MTKQTVQMIDDYFPPQHEAVQTQRCWVVLNAIMGEKIALKSPALKTNTKVPRDHEPQVVRTRAICVS
jgi:hypothetical protein